MAFSQQQVIDICSECNAFKVTMLEQTGLKKLLELPDVKDGLKFVFLNCGKLNKILI